MREFSVDATCPKCGFYWDDQGYNPPYTEYKVGIFNEEKQENWFDNICDGNREYLMRTCCRCEYKWQEKCIEAEEEPTDTSCSASFSCSGTVECSKTSKMSEVLSNLFESGETGHGELTEFGYSGPFIVIGEQINILYPNRVRSFFDIESLLNKGE